MRVLRTAHAWAGAVLSLIIAVLGLSGALLVFKDDYLRLTIPEAREAASLTAQDLGAALERIEATYSDDGLRYVSVAENGFGLHKAVFHDGGGAYVDGNGETVARWAKNGRAEDWLFDLHHHLLAGHTGELVAGAAGIAALVLAATGLIIVWPSLKSFAWRLWPRSSARRDLVAQHRDLGIIFALPILVLSFTGVAMVYSGPVKSMLYAATASGPSPAVERPEAGEGDIDWAAALSAAYAAYPDAAPRIASWPAKPGAAVSLRLRQPMEWHQNGRTYVLIDPATSGLMTMSDAQALSRGDRAFNALYPIHSSGVGGFLYKLASFLTGIALMALGVVGSWSFLIRETRAQQRRTQKQRTLAASS